MVCPKVTLGTVASQKEALSASTLRPPCSPGYLTWVKTADRNLREVALCRVIAWEQMRLEWSGRQIRNTFNFKQATLLIIFSELSVPRKKRPLSHCHLGAILALFTSSLPGYP